MEQSLQTKIWWSFYAFDSSVIGCLGNLPKVMYQDIEHSPQGG